VKKKITHDTQTRDMSTFTHLALVCPGLGDKICPLKIQVWGRYKKKPPKIEMN